MKALRGFLIVATAVFCVSQVANAAVLETVRQRGELVCGTDGSYAGFGLPDASGNWSGFNVDLCKALAAGLKVKHRMRPLTSNERFVALAAGEVDILTMQNTWTMSRDTKLGVRFVATHYYDVQSFLTKKEIGAKKINDLDGGSACVISGSTAEVNLADLFKARNISYKPVTFKSGQESRLAYGAGRCDFIMGDRANLANMRAQLPNREEHVLLEEGFGREPLSISIRKDDDAWFSIVRWTYNALIAAEHLGVTKANAEEMATKTTDAETSNLLGKTDSLWTDLGLDQGYAVRVIAAAGNYGEMWDRNIGPSTPLGLSRGINALWTQGGLQYSPPFK
jgi:general L-amino acid transport system substrate-binding protein